MNTISHQIDKCNFDVDVRFESAGVDSTPRTKSKADAQNCLTHKGAATLADFVVSLARQVILGFTHKPRNQVQGHRLQLIKILYS